MKSLLVGILEQILPIRENDTNPYCMGWESNWLGLQVWDVAYGYKMSIIDEASKKISLQSTAPGINYDFYVFLDPIIEYVDWRIVPILWNLMMIKLLLLLSWLVQLIIRSGLV